MSYSCAIVVGPDGLSSTFMDIRSQTRERQKTVGDLSRLKSRRDKTVAKAGVRLGAVVSDIHGLAARRMIERLVEGGSPEEAMSLSETRLKASNF